MKDLREIKVYWKIRKYRGTVLKGSVVLLSTVFILSLFDTFNHIRRDHYSEYLLRTLEGPLAYDDLELLKYVKEEILEPPSTSPYDVTFHTGNKHHDSEVFYAQFYKTVFENKHNGFFVEAGALDGVSMSNTLWLEMKKGWTGLLIEPEPTNFHSLKKKHRKAWIAKACLSIHKYPKMEHISSVDVVSNRHTFFDMKIRSMGSIVSRENNSFTNNALLQDDKETSYYPCQCFPLATFLLALNVSRVDLLSLDIETFEEEIIKNFDFNKFDIQVLFIEWRLSKNDRVRWLLNYMSDFGYDLVSNEGTDIIFAKRNTEVAGIVAHNNLTRRFVMFKYSKPRNVSYLQVKLNQEEGRWNSRMGNRM